jgi:hypothetical protein
MSAIDISGLCLLAAGAVIAASELVLAGYVWSLPPIEDDPCRERPSAIPDMREEPL